MKTIKFEPSEYLTNEARIAEFINAFIEEAPELLPEALGIVAKAKGMTEIAKKTGISRQALYAVLKENENPTFNTINKVLNAFNVELQAVTKAA
ncbi:MAG: putative addiction module antidote protein [Bifidobacteriaceae bacterium]|jgi:probable addiction module antidote protein|nr:putative addiction module antidote protein [Bifidobacteriaceae bacterium]